MGGRPPLAWLVRPKTEDGTAADAHNAEGFGVCWEAMATAGNNAAAGGVAEPHLVRAPAAGMQAASFAGEQRTAGEIDALHQKMSVTHSSFPMSAKHATPPVGPLVARPSDTDPLCARPQLGSKPPALLASIERRPKSTRCTRNIW